MLRRLLHSVPVAHRGERTGRRRAVTRRLVGHRIAVRGYRGFLDDLARIEADLAATRGLDWDRPGRDQ